VLVLQARADDAPTRKRLAAIGDESTFACLLAERALARALEATCDTALGAYATLESSGSMRLRAWVGAADGSEWIYDALDGRGEDPEGLASALAARLRAVGAEAILRGGAGE
jgi:hydroxymethylbilane synthase